MWYDRVRCVVCQCWGEGRGGVRGGDGKGVGEGEDVEGNG